MSFENELCIFISIGRHFCAPSRKFFVSAAKKLSIFYGCFSVIFLVPYIYLCETCRIVWFKLTVHLFWTFLFLDADNQSNLWPSHICFQSWETRSKNESQTWIFAARQCWCSQVSHNVLLWVLMVLVFIQYILHFCDYLHKSWEYISRWGIMKHL